MYLKSCVPGKEIMKNPINHLTKKKKIYFGQSFSQGESAQVAHTHISQSDYLLDKTISVTKPSYLLGGMNYTDTLNELNWSQNKSLK